MELECRDWLRGEQDEEVQEETRCLRRGWYIGDKTFRDRLLDELEGAISGRKKHSLSGKEIQLYREQRARGLNDCICQHLKISAAERRGRRYFDEDKQMLVALLRKKTGMSYDWIIEELNMGSRASVYNAIRAVKDITSRPKVLKWKKFCKLLN